MACLSGGESRRWTVLELGERLKNLGICASRATTSCMFVSRRDENSAFADRSESENGRNYWPRRI